MHVERILQTGRRGDEMRLNTVICLLTAASIGLLPSCGDDDDDGDRDARAGNGGEPARAGNGGRAGGTGQGGRTGGTGGAATRAGAGGDSGGPGGGGSLAGAGGVESGGAGGATILGGAGGAAAGAGGALGGAGGEATGGLGGAGALEDTEIAHAADTANTGEIEQGTIAEERAQTEAVRDFAEMMVMAHTAARAELRSVAADNDIVLEDNAVSAGLAAQSALVVAALEAALESEFDLVYMQSQVAAHEMVLELMEEEWIPQADDPELRTLLEMQRGAVEAHLTAARATLADLE